MLRNSADTKTVSFMVIVTGLLFLQWNLGDVQPFLFIAAMVMAVPVAVMAHNHNHVPMWKSRFLNAMTDYWLTMFYGYPACAWIPTHNMNHHVLNNRVPDYTITYRISEANNLYTLLTYPTISGGVQQKANFRFIREMWTKDRKKCLYFISQYMLLVTYLAVAFIWNWKKALFFIFLPQQLSLFAVLIFNYIQHVHADEESKWNHSRNFTGWMLNAYLFNNGYHTVHHMSPLRHWSENAAEHAKVANKIDPALDEKSFWWYMVRVYLLGAVFPKFRTESMRLKRIEQSKHSTAPNSAAGKISEVLPELQWVSERT